MEFGNPLDQLFRDLRKQLEQVGAWHDADIRDRIEDTLDAIQRQVEDPSGILWEISQISFLAAGDLRAVSEQAKNQQRDEVIDALKEKTRQSSAAARHTASSASLS